MIKLNKKEQEAVDAFDKQVIIMMEAMKSMGIDADVFCNDRDGSNNDRLFIIVKLTESSKEFNRVFGDLTFHYDVKDKGWFIQGETRPDMISNILLLSANRLSKMIDGVDIENMVIGKNITDKDNNPDQWDFMITVNGLKGSLVRQLIDENGICNVLEGIKNDRTFH